MTDVSFYHLTATPLERALPKLVEKAYEAGKRVLIRTRHTDTMALLDKGLWVYRSDGFLPHGAEGDAAPERQPIYLTTDNGASPPNDATFWFLTEGIALEENSTAERVFDLFNGHDDADVAAARNRWKRYQDAGHTLTYWKQDDAGKWLKAE